MGPSWLPHDALPHHPPTQAPALPVPRPEGSWTGPARRCAPSCRPWPAVREPPSGRATTLQPPSATSVTSRDCGSSGHLAPLLKSHLGFKFPFVKPRVHDVVLNPERWTRRGTSAQRLGPGSLGPPAVAVGVSRALVPGPGLAIWTPASPRTRVSQWKRSTRPPPLTGNDPLGLQPHGPDTRGLTGQLSAGSSGEARVAPRTLRVSG